MYSVGAADDRPYIGEEKRMASILEYTGGSTGVYGAYRQANIYVGV